MDKVFEQAKTLGLTRVYAEVSLTAKAFFLSRGFKIDKTLNNIVLGSEAPQYEMSIELVKE